MKTKEIGIGVLNEVVGTLLLDYKLGSEESKILLDKILLDFGLSGGVWNTLLMSDDLIEEINTYGKSLIQKYGDYGPMPGHFYSGLEHFPNIINLYDNDEENH